MKSYCENKESNKKGKAMNLNNKKIIKEVTLLIQVQKNQNFFKNMKETLAEKVAFQVIIQFMICKSKKIKINLNLFNLIKVICPLTFLIKIMCKKNREENSLVYKNRIQILK